MNSLIKELKQDHIELLSVIEEVKKIGLSGQKGLSRLVQAKSALMTHLKKEDKELYGVLLKAAKTNHKLKDLMLNLAIDMQGFTIYCLEFFEKYSLEEFKNSARFTLDIAKLLVRLKNRITIEENTLYVEYDKCIQVEYDQNMQV